MSFFQKTISLAFPGLLYNEQRPQLKSINSVQCDVDNLLEVHFYHLL